MIEQEQFHTWSRVELCEAKVGQDRTWVMLGNWRTEKICLTTLCILWSRNLTEKFIEHEEGTDLLLPRILVKKPLEVEHRKLYIVYAGTETHGHIGSCLGYALLTFHGRATKRRKDEFRERVGTIIARTLAGEARMETCKDRLAERKRVLERRRARIERGAVDVLEEPGNKNWWAGGGSICGRIWRLNHRDIQFSKRGSGAASEEQSDKWRKTERLKHESPNTSASSDPCVALEYLASGETQSRSGSVFVQKSGHIDDHVQISALDAFYGKDERRSRFIGEVLEWYRGKDAGDIKRIEVVENWTCLNVLEKKILRIYSKDSDGGEILENLEK